MNAFAAYATSTAFSISLSKSLVNVLFLVDEEEREEVMRLSIKGRYKERTKADVDLRTVGLRGLIRRGLVEYRDPPPLIMKRGRFKGAPYSSPYVLTAAGRHILELCKLADLSPLSSRIGEFRKAA